MPLLDHLRQWLDEGKRRVGQVTILVPAETGKTVWSLCHIEDRAAALKGGEGLEQFHDAEAARTIALNNDAGEYRPLRSSPDLRRGWMLEVTDLSQLRLALDHLYPAALGLYRSLRRGEPGITTFREKLQRQTGMYRSANRISDTRAQGLIRRVCNPEGGCLKRILWPISAEHDVHSLPPEKFMDREARPAAEEIPLLCQEACNILVAEARVEARNEVIVIKE
ncbi:MAG: DR2241 family protein [Verrucomicrobiales bacterium]